MNNRTSFDELLDLWLKNKISFDELAALSGKPLAEVKQEAEMHKLASEAIEKYAIREKVSDVHSRYLAARKAKTQVTPPVVPINRNKWMMRVAASVALLTGLYITSENMLLNSERIYKAHFQDYYVNVERSMEGTRRYKIDEYFREGNYNGIIKAYQQLPQRSNKEMFLAGYAYLKEEEYTEASRLFNMILNSNDGDGELLFKDEAEYYLAMTYLKLREVDKAYQLLTKIKEDRAHTFNENVDNWTLTKMKWFK
jgi:tetratricopeptide (TPR) repeat protein